MKETLSLASVRSFLMHRNWRYVHDFKGLAEVWRRQDAADLQELVVPSGNAADYETRYAELLASLSAYEGMSEVELSRAVLSVSYDRLSIRVEHADVLDGTIPIDDGIDLARSSRELLVAAANASLERRRRFQGRLPQEVTQLISHTRLGQTDVGSYVVNVYCTILPATGKEAPFESAVPGTLCAALAGLKSAMDDLTPARSPLVFEDALAQGASSNLCDALIALFGRDARRDVTIAFDPGVGPRLLAPQAFEFKFEAREVDSLRLASDYFKHVYTLLGIEVAGYIKRLDRDIEEDTGFVWVHTTLPNGQEKNVQVQLVESDYQDAIHAHENKRLVRCTGDVIVSPRSARLVNMQSFSVVGAGSLFDFFAGSSEQS